jgi:enoyl-CoA hydratase/carnithine racemase
MESTQRRIATIGQHLLQPHHNDHQTLYNNATNATTDDIFFENFRHGHVIVLNRPDQLNALNTNMIHVMRRWMKLWSNTCAMVIIKGAGNKAFCAGGDIRALAYAARDKDSSIPRNFFGPEYKLVATIFKYPKPYVAILNGITMGGGVGVSIGAAFRVATEKLVFAMPETGIGFVVDVGGSHFLPRLLGPPGLGMYLGLTGARLGPGDCVLSGIATHFVKSENVENVMKQLKELEHPTKEKIAEVLTHYKADHGAAPVFSKGPLISYCFDATTSIEDIIERLEKIADGSIPNEVRSLGEKIAQDWAEGVLKTLASKSPLSLKVVYFLLKKGVSLDIEATLELEYRIAMRMVMKTKEFYEGVRSVIIEKDNKPKWTFKSLAEVDDKYVHSLFEPFSAEEVRELGPELLKIE